jgi:hypothetical protein
VALQYCVVPIKPPAEALEAELNRRAGEGYRVVAAAADHIIMEREAKPRDKPRAAGISQR